MGCIFTSHCLASSCSGTVFRVDLHDAFKHRNMHVTVLLLRALGQHAALQYATHGLHAGLPHSLLHGEVDLAGLRTCVPEAQPLKGITKCSRPALMALAGDAGQFAVFLLYVFDIYCLIYYYWFYIIGFSMVSR